MKTITLNNGVAMPIIGSGTNTYGKVGKEYLGELRGDTQEVDWAIDNGYRHFDTAQVYNNEEVLGQGIAKSSVSREEFFITTKLNTFQGFAGADWAHAEIEKSLKKLQTDTIDLFFLHSPLKFDACARNNHECLNKHESFVHRQRKIKVGA